MNWYKNYTDEQLSKEMLKREYTLDLARTSSLQHPMGYTENCDYNEYWSLKAEFERRQNERIQK